MRRATWSRPTSTPSRRSTRQAFRTPYTPKCAAWVSVILAFRRSSRMARADGGRTLAA